MSGNHKRKRRDAWVSQRYMSVVALWDLLSALGINLTFSADWGGMRRLYNKRDAYHYTLQRYEYRRTRQKL